MTEREWQRRITDMCDLLHLLWYHIPDSRRTNPGFPDLLIVGPGGLLFAELKSDTGRLSAPQKKWLAAIIATGTQAYVWRPDDWPEVEAHLRFLGGRGPTNGGGSRTSP